jgi:sialic acid synthase SpsE
LSGFSDHSGKPFLGIDAISRGCKLLEVHFKVDGIDAGLDLPACLTVDELRLVCEARDYYAERRAA